MRPTVDSLDEEELAIIRALRAKRSGRDEPLPRITPQEFDRRMKVDLGCAAKATRDNSLAKIYRITNAWGDPPQREKGTRATKYPGPLVNLTGTLADLQASWRLHFDHLAADYGGSGAVVYHHRKAIDRYCAAAGIEWHPETSIYEKRSLKARTARSANIELPDDWVARVSSIVNDLEYNKDVAVNAMYQHRARLNFYTAPRCPSEDNRLRLDDVHPNRNALIYRVSKIAGVEAEPVMIPREIFDLGPHVLTWPNRKSWHNWATHWRPKLVDRALNAKRITEDHGWAWVGPRGLQTDPTEFRTTFGSVAKEAWPGFYPYLVREVGIIMRALTIIQQRGYLDLENLVQWSDHVKLDNLRRYTRKARSILRESKPGPELDALLTQWRQI